MEYGVFLILILLQIKHWYVDFVNQTNEEVQWKGTYLDWRGMKHSVKHGLATAVVLFPFVPLDVIIVLSALDFVTHYHIDWTKMNFGNRDIQNPKFWNHLGLDQMAHQLVYVLIAFLVLVV